jgi:hypothetical protein
MTNPQALDERIAVAEAAGDWPTANALKAEQLAALAREDARPNAGPLAATDTNAGSTASHPAGGTLDEQIAEATAEQDWERLNELNAQRLARLAAEADAATVEASAVGEVIAAARSFRLHTDGDPNNPEHAAILAAMDRAKTNAQLIEVYERQRAADRRREFGHLARFLP